MDTYGLKYQSDFYNFFGKVVSVQIYKKDYEEESEPIYVRTQKVTIEVNYQDENTGVIGTGAKIVIIADTNQLTQYEDLLTSLEKQFLCIIVYDNNVVFQGFSICDLNERQFLPFAAITLQFTDYLRRLESFYPLGLKAAGENSSVFSIIQEALVKIDLDYTLYINSSLFEERMNQGPTDDFTQQTFIDNYLFHSAPTEYDNAYAALNKLLLSFNAYLYSYRGMWYLERQEDILRDDAWIRYMDIDMSSASADSFVNQKQHLHRQAEDFKYIEMSQVVAYESGLKTLILRLQDKQLESFIFNDYSLDNVLETSEMFPSSGSLIERQWYRHTNVTLTNFGFAYRDISSYIKWTYLPSLGFNDREFAGLYYETEIQFPVTPEEPVVLSLSYKQSPGEIQLIPSAGGAKSYVRARFCIRFVGGVADGRYMYYDPNSPTDLYSMGIVAVATETIFMVEPQTKPVFNVSQSFNLTDQKQYQSGSLLQSVWEDLGRPEKQKFMVFFFPLEFWVIMPPTGNPAPPPEFHVIPTTQILGDVELSMTSQKILNKLTYYVNKDFEKTDEVDIDIFDLDNINFANGPKLQDESTSDFNSTKKWTSLLNSTPVPLMDIFAKSRFQNYARTIHRLKSKILFDGYLKPFAVLTDDNLKVQDAEASDVGQNIQLIVQNYTWDLNEGTYDIDAQEYTDEDLGFDLAQDEGGGTGPLVAPSNIILEQLVAGEGVDMSWNAVSGAIGYIVQRQPYYDAVSDSWISQWKTVWEGAQLQTYDPIQLEHTPMPPTLHLMYRVAAKTSLIYGPYSDSQVIIWSAI
jgi:hypothetical protein